MDNLEDLDWNKESYLKFIEYLKQNKDEKYIKFQLGILGVHKNIIGLKTPILRDIAQKISKGDWKSFIRIAQKNYYEESVLKGLVIGYVDIPLEDREKYIEEYIKDVDNWAVCDICVGNFKFIKDNKEYFYLFIKKCIKSDNPWKIRIGLVAILNFYLEKKYLKDIFDIVESIKSDDYYVKMAQAWLISILFINFRDETLVYLQENNLDNWIQNKGIQKIRESARVSVEDKRLILNYKK